PFGVIELIREEAGGPRLAHLVQRVNQCVGADDPKHIEPAERVHGHEALALDGFGGLRLGRLAFSRRSHCEEPLGESRGRFKVKQSEQEIRNLRKSQHNRAGLLSLVAPGSDYGRGIVFWLSFPCQSFLCRFLWINSLVFFALFVFLCGWSTRAFQLSLRGNNGSGWPMVCPAANPPQLAAASLSGAVFRPS